MKRFQFRLSTLLLLTAVISCLLAWQTSKVRTTRRKRSACQHIERLGGAYMAEWLSLRGFIRHLLGSEYYAQVRGVDLSGCVLADEDLAPLQHLRGLYELNLTGSTIADDGLAYVAMYPDLRILDLSMTNVSDKGLEHLASMRTLVVLNLVDTRISDLGIPYLPQIRTLEYIDLTGTGVSSSGVRRLRELMPNTRIVLGEPGTPPARPAIRIDPPLDIALR